MSGVKHVVVELPSLDGDMKAMEEYINCFNKHALGAVLLVSKESTGTGKISILISVPRGLVEQIKANEWGAATIEGCEGRIGGKDVTARGVLSGGDTSSLVAKAEKYATQCFS